MAVRADKREVVYVRFLAREKRGNRLCVMALDEPFATLSVDNSKIKTTRFTRQAAVLSHNLFAFALDQGATALPGQVSSCE